MALGWQVTAVATGARRQVRRQPRPNKGRRTVLQIPGQRLRQGRMANIRGEGRADGTGMATGADPRGETGLARIIVG